MEPFKLPFDLHFLNQPNWEALYKLATEKLATSKNPILLELWQALELEAGFRKEGVQRHAAIVIRLENIPPPVIIESIEVIGTMSKALSAAALFRSTALLTETIQAITMIIRQSHVRNFEPTDKERSDPN